MEGRDLIVVMRWEAPWLDAAPLRAAAPAVRIVTSDLMLRRSAARAARVHAPSGLIAGREVDPGIVGLYDRYLDATPQALIAHPVRVSVTFGLARAPESTTFSTPLGELLPRVAARCGSDLLVRCGVVQAGPEFDTAPRTALDLLGRAPFGAAMLARLLFGPVVLSWAAGEDALMIRIAPFDWTTPRNRR